MMDALTLKRTTERYERTLAEYDVPRHLHEGLIGYVLYGHQTGGFLFHCLCDRLTEAVVRAGADITIDHLRAIAKWLYNEPPAPCRGSEEAVNRWNARGGEAGL
jgi:hypothetical protein